MSTPVYPNDVDVRRYFILRDANTGQPKTGYTITDLDLQYTRIGSAPAAKVDATALAATDSAHADNKAIEINSTSSPGLYRVDWPDAAFAAGVDGVLLCVSGPGLDPAFEEIPLRFPPGILRIGTTQSGGSLTSAVLDAGASATDEAYRDAIFRIRSGTHAGKTRQIMAYTGSSKTCDFFDDDALSAAPNNVDYEIIVGHQARLQSGHEPPAIPLSGTQGQAVRNMTDMIQVGGYVWVDLRKIAGDATAVTNMLAAMLSELVGAASGGGHTTTSMGTNLSETVSNKFVGRRIYWTSGVLNRETAIVLTYDGTTKRFTYAATTAAPSNGDTFVII